MNSHRSSCCLNYVNHTLFRISKNNCINNWDINSFCQTPCVRNYAWTWRPNLSISRFLLLVPILPETWKAEILSLYLLLSLFVGSFLNSSARFILLWKEIACLTPLSFINFLWATSAATEKRPHRMNNLCHSILYRNYLQLYSQFPV